MLFFKSSILQPFSNVNQSASFSLGFLLIFAFLFGKGISHLKLPQIAGFIIAGILCGPYILKFLSFTDVKDLQLLDGLALSLIALTAGGEMKIEKLRGSLKLISFVVIFQTIIILGGFMLFGFAARHFFSFFSDKTLLQTAVISLLLGTLATATSPSTTIAVITETRSKGKFTDLVLSAAVVKDFLIIGLFTVFLSFSKSLLDSIHAFDFGFLLHILRELGGSLIIGAIVGGGIILYLKYIKREMAVFILSVAFFTYQISQSYGYHPLIICLVAGFLVENFSPHGERLILSIEKSALPIFVVFFAISGASLNIDALRRSWVLALVCVVLRGALKFSGTFIGAKLAKEDSKFQKLSWIGFISQAGVALGMAILIERTFPEWGAEFKALVLAIIAMNQVIGPVMLQRLLFRVNEAGKRDSLGFGVRGSWEEEKIESFR